MWIKEKGVKMKRSCWIRVYRGYVGYEESRRILCFGLSFWMNGGVIYWGKLGRSVFCRWF